MRKHTNLEGQFQQSISNKTFEVFKKCNSRTPHALFSLLRTDWIMKQEDHGSFCIWHTDKHLADKLGTSSRSIQTYIKFLVKEGLLVCVPFHSSDHGNTSKTNGNERRWLVPIDLAMTTRKELLKECKKHLEEMNRYPIKVKAMLSVVIDNLDRDFLARTETELADQKLDELFKHRKKPSKRCLALYPSAHTFCQEDLECAESVIEQQSKRRRKDFKTLAAICTAIESSKNENRNRRIVNEKCESGIESRR